MRNNMESPHFEFFAGKKTSAMKISSVHTLFADPETKAAQNDELSFCVSAKFLLPLFIRPNDKHV